MAHENKASHGTSDTDGVGPGNTAHHSTGSHTSTARTSRAMRSRERDERARSPRAGLRDLDLDMDLSFFGVWQQVCRSQYGLPTECLAAMPPRWQATKRATALGMRTTSA